MANEAKRAQADPIDPQLAHEGMRAVADQLGCRVERMRMTDYDQAVREGAQAPPVAAILATFDSWKAARSGAGERND